MSSIRFVHRNFTSATTSGLRLDAEIAQVIVILETYGATSYKSDVNSEIKQSAYEKHANSLFSTRWVQTISESPRWSVFTECVLIKFSIADVLVSNAWIMWMVNCVMITSPIASLTVSTSSIRRIMKFSIREHRRNRRARFVLVRSLSLFVLKLTLRIPLLSMHWKDSTLSNSL